MSTLAAHGISVTLPPGWDGRIARRAESGGPGAEHPVVHLASFALPATRGDFGSGAVERMRQGDVLICLIESAPSDTASALFSRRGVPRVRVRDFSPDQMQRTLPGMSGTQAFFTAGQRAFCLYVVLGSHRSRASLVPAVNDVLTSVQIASRR